MKLQKSQLIKSFQHYHRAGSLIENMTKKDIPQINMAIYLNMSISEIKLVQAYLGLAKDKRAMEYIEKYIPKANWKSEGGPRDILGDPEDTYTETDPLDDVSKYLDKNPERL